MPSIDALVAAIRAVRAALADVARTAAAARRSAGDLSAGFAVVGAGDKVAAVEEIGRGIEEEQAAVAEIENSAEEAEARADALRSGSGGGSTAPPPAPAPSAAPFKPMRTDRAKADEIRPYVGEPIAYATLYDEHGMKLVGVHNAGDDGPAADADWREPWGSYPRLRRHVEAHAAARMARDGHRQLAIYLNLPPCSYPDGCKINLSDLIPKGATLWVHQVRASGTVDVKPFKGTGRALRDD